MVDYCHRTRGDPKEHTAPLGIPEELDVVDVMCFGPPLKPSYKRWKKPLEQILNWDRFNPENLMTDEQIEDWIKTRRHKVMYRDEALID